MIDEAKVDVDPTTIENTSTEMVEWQIWLNEVIASLMTRTLKLLSVPINKKWNIKPSINLSSLSDQLRQLEMKYFQDLDGVMLMKNFFLSAHS